MHLRSCGKDEASNQEDHTGESNKSGNETGSFRRGHFDRSHVACCGCLARFESPRNSAERENSNLLWWLPISYAREYSLCNRATNGRIDASSFPSARCRVPRWRYDGAAMTKRELRRLRVHCSGSLPVSSADNSRVRLRVEDAIKPRRYIRFPGTHNGAWMFH